MIKSPTAPNGRRPTWGASITMTNDACGRKSSLSSSGSLSACAPGLLVGASPQQIVCLFRFCLSQGFGLCSSGDWRRNKCAAQHSVAQLWGPLGCARKLSASRLRRSIILVIWLALAAPKLAPPRWELCCSRRRLSITRHSHTTYN